MLATSTIPSPTSTPTPEPTSTPTLAPTHTLAPTVPPTAAIISLEECVQYDPASLQIKQLGEEGWGLEDGIVQVTLLDNEVDAQLALALAQRHNEVCFIRRAYSDRYFMQYWKGESGISSSLRNVDCLTYNPEALDVIFDANLWSIVEDGYHFLLSFEKEEAAILGLEVVKQYSKVCFIGRDNSRENRWEYIITY